MHTDFNSYNHPRYGKPDRRLNLLLYMNEELHGVGGGDLLLVNSKVKTEVCHRIRPKFNQAVIFSTSKIALHGHPEPWNGTVPRTSLAAYYYTKSRNAEKDFEGDAPHTTLWHPKPTKLVDRPREQCRATVI